METAEENRKIVGALNFLAPEGTLKKSWEIHALVKNLLTQWETEEENRGINRWNDQFIQLVKNLRTLLAGNCRGKPISSTQVPALLPKIVCSWPSWPS